MDFTNMTNFLDSLPDFGVPGVDCIIQKGHEVLYRHFAGCSDRETGAKMTGKEHFFLYSTTKPITCTAVLQLFEQGKLHLNDPVSQYIPEFANVQVKHTDDEGNITLSPAQTPITIGHLLTMRSGFGYDLDAAPIREVIDRTDGRAPTLEVVKAIASVPLWFEPGTHWGYGLSHDILGGVIEVITGKTFGQYLKDNIFDPLGMENTGFALTEERKAKMMAKYRHDPDTNTVSRIPLESEFILGSQYEAGGAGLISTVEDYAKFAAAMASDGYAPNGTRILSRATIDLMRTNFLTEEQRRDFNWPYQAGYGYGLGVRTLVSPAEAGSPGPVGEFGWDGAAGCYVLIDPENHLSLFYAQQMRQGFTVCQHTIPRLRNLLYTSL